MKMKFTRLVCVGLGVIFGSVSLSAQKVEEFQIGVDGIYHLMVQQEDNSPKQDLQLRKDENKIPEVLPDSIITYSANGEKVSKMDNISDNYMRYKISYYTWNNSTWDKDENARYLYTWNFSYDDNKKILWWPNMGLKASGWYQKIDTWSDQDGNETIHPVNATYNGDGQVNKIDVMHDYKNEVSITYHFTYNSNGQLISSFSVGEIGYNYKDKTSQRDFYYDENGNMILCEDYMWRYEQYNPPAGEHKRLWEGNERQIAKYDSQGRKIREERYVGNSELQRYLLNEYDVYYYSDGHTPNAEIENNTPVNNNQGGFDLSVNIPADSVQSGSLVVQLPEGFTLDEANTSLTVDFAGLFDLTLTKQENNSWLIEIKPKSLKNGALRSDEIGKMLHIAYKVNDSVTKGTYNISINSIQFKTPGDNIIPEPAITVPVNVNRWGVSNEQLEDSNTAVYITGNTIYIQTTQTEQIAIYTINGSKLYETTVQSGTTTVNAITFPQGVLIVKGSSGWVKKVVAP